MKAMIIVPTYNERDNIGKLVREILAFEEGFFVTIVDDSSPDGTGDVADLLSAESDRVHVIHRPRKSGLGTAYLDGFRYALTRDMDFIFEMDADFSHDPRYLPAMLKAAQEADVVIGSRYFEGVRVDGWRFRRLLLSKLANMYASYVVIIPVWDFTAGFICYRRKVLESIDFGRIRSDGYGFQIELKTYAYRLGFRLKEVPIIFQGRASGDSKLSKGIAWEAFWTVLRLRSPFMEIMRHLKFLTRDYSEFVRNRDLPGA